MALPALMRAQKLQKRAARVGFEWPDVSGAVEKFKEEMDEFEEALASNMTQNDADHLREEFGDVMFTLINIGRMMGYDVEEVTREANKKFDSRFRGMEDLIKLKHYDFSDATLDEMEQAWQEVKNK